MVADADTKSTFPDNPFWKFSLRIYSKDGVASACLSLQERHGLDINILLYLCWLGAHEKRGLDEPSVRQIVNTVGPWHDGQVRGLRQLRIDLKANKLGAPEGLGESLRDQIKSSELYAERIEQMMLHQLGSRLTGQLLDDPHTAVEQNMRGYLAVLDIDPSVDDLVDFAVLWNAAVA